MIKWVEVEITKLLTISMKINRSERYLMADDYSFEAWTDDGTEHGKWRDVTEMVKSLPPAMLEDLIEIALSKYEASRDE